MTDESPLVFPKKADQARINRYAHYDKLYFGEHYDAFTVLAEAGFSTAYAKLRYIVGNFGGLMSRVMADMLFGDNFTVDVKDSQTQDFIDGLMETNQLTTQLHESALGNSRRGDSCFKLRIGPRHPSDAKPSIILEEFTPAIYYPKIDVNSTRNTPVEESLATVFRRDGVTYLHKETHVPGTIRHEIYKYDEQAGKILPGELDPADFGFQAEEDTRVKRSLLFHIPNVRDGSGYFGTSDYSDLESLFFALNNRITKVDNILDKHSDPILAVPAGVLDEDGNVKKASLGMFEVNSENPGFNKPEYVVWNANLESAFKQIDKLVELLFMFSEIAPATMGADKGGEAESGRALKFKLLATIRKRNRKKRYYEQAIKDMLETAQELSLAHGVSVNDIMPKAPERPTIDWGDGVINDIVEMVDMAVARIDAGLSSRADEIASLDGITPDEAKEKVKEIDEEAAPAVAPITNNLNGGTPPAPQPPNQPPPGS